jgi:single-stranded-DNA-specific exonuclease
LAVRLDTLNRERREIEQDMRDTAFARVERELEQQSKGELPPAFCLFEEDWHQGVVGIVAARIKDRFHRPTIAFAAADSATLKGSARSVAGLHIRDALDTVAARYPGLLTRFGGHAMAAGLVIARDALAAFRAAFLEVVDATLDARARERLIEIDGELAPGDLSLDLARELMRIVPWGQACPEPRFAGRFRVDDRRVVGGRHVRLVLTLHGARKSVSAIAFDASDQAWATQAEHISAVYKLDINDWGGVESVQLVLDYAEAS